MGSALGERPSPSRCYPRAVKGTVSGSRWMAINRRARGPCRRVPVTTISTCRLPQWEQTSRSRQIEHGRFGAPPGSHLGRVRDRTWYLDAPKSRVRAVPEPLGIGVYRRCDHPVDCRLIPRACRPWRTGSAADIPRSPRQTLLGQPRGVGAGQGARAGSPDHPPIGQSDGAKDLSLLSM
jgi:hypothetical protein